jgi:hypothetical protein
LSVLLAVPVAVSGTRRMNFRINVGQNVISKFKQMVFVNKSQL